MKNYTCNIEVRIQAKDHNEAELILLNLYDLLKSQPSVIVPFQEDEELVDNE